jgi:heme/copper-type cytochrome/quinol oxidase subunit 3
MENTKNKILLGLGAIATAGLVTIGVALKRAHSRVHNLENQLASVEAHLNTAQLKTDFYQRELIKYGNPEGWQLSGDAFGSVFYIRDNGDMQGNCWKEYLPAY